MESIDFKEIAELLNETTSVEIEPVPAKSSKGNWDLYCGEYKVHGERLEFEVLYLHSKAAVDALKNAAGSVYTKEKTRVVFPPSLDQRTKVHRELFADAKTLGTTQEYLASFLSEELKVYSNKLIAKEPKWYIDPQIKVPIGVNKKIPNPVINALTDIRDNGELIVLLADPGQGKTFMSEYVVSKIASLNNNFFPIFINSEQWATMGPAELGSLWKTITHSFRHLEAPIGWLAGNEGTFVQTTLKAGLFCIVFDGFDEYILQNHGKVSALETIDLLADLVKETSARILVTSRTSFWESEIEGQKEFDEHDLSYSKYQIRPFETNLARQYFESRLNKTQSSKATQLYAELSKQDKNFVGRGFTLSLIADLYSDSPPDRYHSTVSPLMWIMEALCARETRRQGLPINSEEQIKCLSQFAVETLQEEEPSYELLDFCIENTSPKLSPDARRDCINNMSPHPLIQKNKESGNWEFPQKQVKVILTAKHLLDASDPELSIFAKKARVNDDFASDIATSLVHLLRRSESYFDDSKKLIGSFLNPKNHGHLDGIDTFDCLHKLSVLVALRSTDAENLKSGEDRAQYLLSLFPEEEFNHLPFSGAIAKYDFSSAKFTKCRFDHVRWGNCKFGPETIFDHCTFIGSGSVNYCTNFGLSTWINPIADDDGFAFIDAQKIESGSKAYDSNHLKRDLDSVLKRFFSPGGIGFKKINVNHIASGQVGLSRHKDEIIKVLSDHVIDIVNGPGTAEKDYYVVRKEAEEDMRFLFNNNIFTGTIKSAYQILKADLCP